MSTRLRIFVIGLGTLAIVAVYTFPLWQPYFVDDVVDEDFPGLAPGLQRAFTALPPDVQAAYLAMAGQNPQQTTALLSAALSPDVTVPEAEQEMPAANPVMLSSGGFADVDLIRRGRGSATSYQSPDGSRFLRFEDFRVTNGPELHVLLAEHPNPRSLSEVQQGFVDLGRLKGNVGSQNYAIPREIDLSQYASVVIYCLPFHIVFSTATLFQPG